MNIAQPTITPEFLKSQGLSHTFVERFWAKVDKNGPVPEHVPELGQCWRWTASCHPWGYGQISKGGKHNSGHLLAHVASWILHFGPVPQGLEVTHRCDCPQCSRPDHLRLGTHADNMRDCIQKKRNARGEKCGSSKLTQAQADEIRRRFVKGKRGPKPSGNYKELMREFGIGMWSIHAIAFGRAWKSD